MAPHLFHELRALLDDAGAYLHAVLRVGAGDGHAVRVVERDVREDRAGTHRVRVVISAPVRTHGLVSVGGRAPHGVDADVLGVPLHSDLELLRGLRLCRELHGDYAGSGILLGQRGVEAGGCFKFVH